MGLIFFADIIFGNREYPLPFFPTARFYVKAELLLRGADLSLSFPNIYVALYNFA